MKGYLWYDFWYCWLDCKRILLREILRILWRWIYFCQVHNQLDILQKSTTSFKISINWLVSVWYGLTPMCDICTHRKLLSTTILANSQSPHVKKTTLKTHVRIWETTYVLCDLILQDKCLSNSFAKVHCSNLLCLNVTWHLISPQKSHWPIQGVL